MALTSGITKSLTQSLTKTLLGGTGDAAISGPIVWTPAASTAYIWLDPADDSNLTTSGGELTSITSKIGTATFVQEGAKDLPGEPIAAGQSMMVDNRNAKGALYTTDAYAMSFSNNAASMGFMLVCCIQDATASFRNAFAGGNAASSTVYFARGGTDESFSQSVRENDGSNLAQLNTGSGVASDGCYIITGQIVAGTGVLKELRVNGTALTTSTDTITWDATDFTFMNYLSASGGSNRWNDLMGDMLMYNTQFTDAEAEKFEGYAAWKYGGSFRDKLPDDHPYKEAVPTL